MRLFFDPMKNIILFDSEIRTHLLPFTFLRPVSELRIGMMTIREKWQLEFSQAHFSHITADHLEPKYPITIADDNILINSALLPDAKVVVLLKGLGLNQAILSGEELIAARLDRAQFDRLIKQNELEELEGVVLAPEKLTLISSLQHLLEHNSDEILNDLERKHRAGHALENLSEVSRGEYKVFTQGKIDLSGVILDTSKGPIIIGPEAVVLPGSMLSGPVSIGAGARVKMGSMIYGGTTVGPYSMVAGEVKNSLIMSASNKSHEGYLGDSVIGSWCNLGALTSNSNLKNSFGEIKLWNYATEDFEATGLIKCGLFMGDYSRSAIHTTFNSGTVVGISSNVMASGFPKKFIPSFVWGEKAIYDLPKAIKAGRSLHSFKNQSMDTKESELLSRAYDLSAPLRGQFL